MSKRVWSEAHGLSLFAPAVTALVYLALFVLALTLAGCLATVPLSPTVPDLPAKVKEPPRPFPKPPGT